MTGQGAALLQKEANRDVKSHLPTGTAIGETWRRVSNAANDLKEFKQRLLKKSPVDPHTSDRKYKKSDLEVNMMITMIWKAEILTPGIKIPPKSITGKFLANDLAQVHHIENNYEITITETSEFPRQKLPMVCISR